MAPWQWEDPIRVLWIWHLSNQSVVETRQAYQSFNQPQFVTEWRHQHGMQYSTRREEGKRNFIRLQLSGRCYIGLGAKQHSKNITGQQYSGGYGDPSTSRCTESRRRFEIEGQFNGAIKGGLIEATSHRRAVENINQEVKHEDDPANTTGRPSGII